MPVKFTPQHDQMDFGSACLVMATAWYGKTYPLQYFREQCHITREGVSLRAIGEAAKQIGMDKQAVKATVANTHDSKGLASVLKKVPKRYKSKGVWTDNGYKVPDNDALLSKENIKNRIQRKAYRNRPLSHWEKKFNKLISQTRYVVERTFGSMKRWFGAGATRYKGLAKTHTLHVLEVICYNLKRSPGLVRQLAK